MRTAEFRHIARTHFGYEWFSGADFMRATGERVDSNAMGALVVRGEMIRDNRGGHTHRYRLVQPRRAD